MTANESRPTGAASVAGEPESILGGWRVPGEALAWYQSGLDHGIDLGRRQVEAELAAAYAPVREHVARLIKTNSYVELCVRRGEPARAARARETSRRLGVTA